jgi:membrane-bound ClpP family serine protease
VTTLSYEDWLYRKADQYAHNEILAFIMMVLGMVSLVGGLTVTVVMSGQILLIPILETYPLSPSSSVGFMLTTGGFTVLLAGFVLAVYYDRKRTWHVGEIEKGNHLKNRKIDINVVKKTFEDFSKEEKPVRPSSRQKKRELKESAV